MTTTRLIIDVRPGEVLAVSGRACVELIQKSGQRARLRVTAESDVKIEKRDALRTKHGTVTPD